MKNYLLFICCFFAFTAFSQTTWNKSIPIGSFGSNFSFFDATYDNGRFLLCGATKMAELNQLGDILGTTTVSSALYYNNFLRRRNTSNTGEQSFLVGARKLSSSSPYSLRFFSPEHGFGEIVELMDSSNAFKPPVVLTVDDSTLVVFGRTGSFKIRVHEQNAFSVLWQMPLTYPGVLQNTTKTAVQANGSFILFSSAGHILGVNSSGQQVFSKVQPFTFNAAQVLPDGIITCGTNSKNTGVLVKLTFSGDTIWSRSFDDLLYNQVVITNDGGFVVTGRSANNRIVLVKTDGNGALLWSKEYQAGTGIKVLSLPEGGYFILAAAASTVFAIKTDVSGQTGVPQTTYFDINRQIKTSGVQAIFSPNASLFFNGTNGTLISPPDSGAATILSFAPWMGGLDGDGQLHLVAETYGGDFSDFNSGMIGGEKGDFGRVWLADKAAIAALRLDFLTDHVIDQEIPYDLLTWPAKGNLHNKYNMDFTVIKTDPNLQAAPFVDFNGDGLYNVFDGDYPRMKGDQMAWWMVNDDSIHLQSAGAPLYIDLGISAYVFDCQENESVKNSIFVDFQFINRSNLAYENTYLGLFTDFDLGCYLDDYLGSLPNSNTYYSYNMDALDDGCFGNDPGFGAHIPVQTVTVQNKALNKFIYSQNNTGNPNPAQTNPDSPLEYYHYLQGRWKDGTPLTVGGTGYNPGSTDYSNYAYSSNPSDPQGWSMCTVVPPLTDDRALGSHGPFTLLAGDTFNVTIAFTTHQNIPHPCPDITGLVQPAIDQLTSWTNAGVLDQSPNLGVVQEIALGQTLTLGANIPGASFQWSTGAASPTITISQPGDYSVTITSETGCKTIENVLVKTATGTFVPTQELSWSVFPNPALEAIQVSCPSSTSGKGDLQVILRNAQGVALKRENVSSSTHSIPLQGIPSGLYWLELWEGGKFQGSRKFSHVVR